MDPSTVVELGNQALWMTVLISAPLLGMALAVGLVIGIVQAATSVNEATLSFIPKLVGIAIAMVIFGNWQIALLSDYFRAIFHRIPVMFS
mgnify:CR=1 FL=1